MPNEFDLSPNFVNPAYSTPEQVKQLRDYASQLQAASIAPTATHWTGALAQALMGLSAATNANRANVLQQQALGQAGQNLSRIPLAPNMPSNIPQGMSSPYPATSRNETVGVASGEPRGVRNNNPGNIKDSSFARSQPGYVGSDGTFARYDTPQHGAAAMDSLLLNYSERGLNTPASIINRWAPPSENDTGSYVATVSNQIGVSPNTRLDMRDPNQRTAMRNAMMAVELGPQHAQRYAQNLVNPQAYGSAMVNPWIPEQAKHVITESVTPREVGKDPYGRPIFAAPIGGQAQAPVGYTPGMAGNVTVGPEGGISAPTVVSPGGGGLGAGVRGTVESLMPVSREAASQGAVTKAQAGGIGTDMQMALAAPQVMQILSAMRDDIKLHGDKMPWGPHADWVNNLKRDLAQFAPGFLSKEQIDGLASADSFDKLTAQLQTIIGSAGPGTDQRLMQSMRSTPGAHNSKEGALALIDMLSQTVDMNRKFMAQAYGKVGQPGYNHLEEKTRFFNANPITNPLTGNPIRTDLQGSQEPGQAAPSGDRIINGKTYRKINGKWHEVS